MTEAATLPTFEPAPDLAAWLAATFIIEGAPLENPDHAHLRAATLGCLWTTVENTRQQRRVVGMAELGEARGTMGKWPKARADQQTARWFGQTPDFVLTFAAGYAAACDDASFCAVVEHELYHCGQDRDEFGLPKFRKSSGLPVFAIRGHDVEEFVGVAKRYGAAATGLTDLKDALNTKPTIAKALIAGACGTCALKRAA